MPCGKPNHDCIVGCSTEYTILILHIQHTVTNNSPSQTKIHVYLHSNETTVLICQSELEKIYI